ncbi:hypothetical protein BESB_013050 [Besnoitia besnoiti]|uniref:Uncharacterized protein n=1 Tax=Besnoitia besnoiti TaxID=94643 RepID=A0A2A9MAH5_BESBE|nr:hypothetical protein BESB_013050 [Besnoitia besnoiti]PFH32693.1 hypothetical protein BESB_013050 [Besnoitia besnoiti]
MERRRLPEQPSSSGAPNLSPSSSSASSSLYALSSSFSSSRILAQAGERGADLSVHADKRRRVPRELSPPRSQALFRESSFHAGSLPPISLRGCSWPSSPVRPSSPPFVPRLAREIFKSSSRRLASDSGPTHQKLTPPWSLRNSEDSPESRPVSPCASEEAQAAQREEARHSPAPSRRSRPEMRPYSPSPPAPSSRSRSSRRRSCSTGSLRSSRRTSVDSRSSADETKSGRRQSNRIAGVRNVFSASHFLLSSGLEDEAETTEEDEDGGKSRGSGLRHLPELCRKGQRPAVLHAGPEDWCGTLAVCSASDSSVSSTEDRRRRGRQEERGGARRPRRHRRQRRTPLDSDSEACEGARCGKQEEGERGQSEGREQRASSRRAATASAYAHPAWGLSRGRRRQLRAGAEWEGVSEDEEGARRAASRRRYAPVRVPRPRPLQLLRRGAKRARLIPSAPLYVVEGEGDFYASTVSVCEPANGHAAALWLTQLEGDEEQEEEGDVETASVARYGRKRPRSRTGERHLDWSSHESASSERLSGEASDGSEETDSDVEGRNARTRRRTRCSSQSESPSDGSSSACSQARTCADGRKRGVGGRGVWPRDRTLRSNRSVVSVAGSGRYGGFADSRATQTEGESAPAAEPPNAAGADRLFDDSAAMRRKARGGEGGSRGRVAERGSRGEARGATAWQEVKSEGGREKQTGWSTRVDAAEAVRTDRKGEAPRGGLQEGRTRAGSSSAEWLGREGGANPRRGADAMRGGQDKRGESQPRNVAVKQPSAMRAPPRPAKQTSLKAAGACQEYSKQSGMFLSRDERRRRRRLVLAAYRLVSLASRAFLPAEDEGKHLTARSDEALYVSIEGRRYRLEKPVFHEATAWLEQVEKLHCCRDLLFIWQAAVLHPLLSAPVVAALALWAVAWLIPALRPATSFSHSRVVDPPSSGAAAGIQARAGISPARWAPAPTAGGDCHARSLNYRLVLALLAPPAFPHAFSSSEALGVREPRGAAANGVTKPVEVGLSDRADNGRATAVERRCGDVARTFRARAWTLAIAPAGSCRLVSLRCMLEAFLLSRATFAVGFLSLFAACLDDSDGDAFVSQATHVAPLDAAERREGAPAIAVHSTPSASIGEGQQSPRAADATRGDRARVAAFVASVARASLLAGVGSLRTDVHELDFLRVFTKEPRSLAKARAAPRSLSVRATGCGVSGGPHPAWVPWLCAVSSASAPTSLASLSLELNALRASSAPEVRCQPEGAATAAVACKAGGAESAAGVEGKASKAADEASADAVSVGRESSPQPPAGPGSPGRVSTPELVPSCVSASSLAETSFVCCPVEVSPACGGPCACGLPRFVVEVRAEASSRTSSLLLALMRSDVFCSVFGACPLLSVFLLNLTFRLRFSTDAPPPLGASSPAEGRHPPLGPFCPPCASPSASSVSRPATLALSSLRGPSPSVSCSLESTGAECPPPAFPSLLRCTSPSKSVWPVLVLLTGLRERFLSVCSALSSPAASPSASADSGSKGDLPQASLTPADGASPALLTPLSSCQLPLSPALKNLFAEIAVYGSHVDPGGMRRAGQNVAGDKSRSAAAPVGFSSSDAASLGSFAPRTDTPTSADDAEERVATLDALLQHLGAVLLWVVSCQAACASLSKPQHPPASSPASSSAASETGLALQSPSVGACRALARELKPLAQALTEWMRLVACLRQALACRPSFDGRLPRGGTSPLLCSRPSPSSDATSSPRAGASRLPFASTGFAFLSWAAPVAASVCDALLPSAHPLSASALLASLPSGDLVALSSAKQAEAVSRLTADEGDERRSEDLREREEKRRNEGRQRTDEMRQAAEKKAGRESLRLLHELFVGEERGHPEPDERVRLSRMPAGVWLASPNRPDAPLAASPGSLEARIEQEEPGVRLIFEALTGGATAQRGCTGPPVTSSRADLSLLEQAVTKGLIGLACAAPLGDITADGESGIAPHQLEGSLGSSPQEQFPRQLFSAERELSRLCGFSARLVYAQLGKLERLLRFADLTKSARHLLLHAASWARRRRKERENGRGKLESDLRAAPRTEKENNPCPAAHAPDAEASLHRAHGRLGPSFRTSAAGANDDEAICGNEFSFLQLRGCLCVDRGLDALAELCFSPHASQPGTVNVSRPRGTSATPAPASLELLLPLPLALHACAAAACASPHNAALALFSLPPGRAKGAPQAAAEAEDRGAGHGVALTSPPAPEVPSRLDSPGRGTSGTVDAPGLQICPSLPFLRLCVARVVLRLQAAFLVPGVAPLSLAPVFRGRAPCAPSFSEVSPASPLSSWRAAAERQEEPEGEARGRQPSSVRVSHCLSLLPRCEQLVWANLYDALSAKGRLRSTKSKDASERLLPSSAASSQEPLALAARGVFPSAVVAGNLASLQKSPSSLSASLSLALPSSLWLFATCSHELFSRLLWREISSDESLALEIGFAFFRDENGDDWDVFLSPSLRSSHSPAALHADAFTAPAVSAKEVYGYRSELLDALAVTLALPRLPDLRAGTRRPRKSQDEKPTKPGGAPVSMRAPLKLRGCGRRPLRAARAHVRRKRSPSTSSSSSMGSSSVVEGGATDSDFLPDARDSPRVQRACAGRPERRCGREEESAERRPSRTLAGRRVQEGEVCRRDESGRRQQFCRSISYAAPPASSICVDAPAAEACLSLASPAFLFRLCRLAAFRVVGAFLEKNERSQYAAMLQRASTRPGDCGASSPEGAAGGRENDAAPRDSVHSGLPSDLGYERGAYFAGEGRRGLDGSYRAGAAGSARQARDEFEADSTGSDHSLRAGRGEALRSRDAGESRRRGRRRGEAFDRDRARDRAVDSESEWESSLESSVSSGETQTENDLDPGGHFEAEEVFGVPARGSLTRLAFVRATESERRRLASGSSRGDLSAESTGALGQRRRRDLERQSTRCLHHGSRASVSRSRGWRHFNLFLLPLLHRPLSCVTQTTQALVSAGRPERESQEAAPPSAFCLGRERSGAAFPPLHASAPSDCPLTSSPALSAHGSASAIPSCSPRRSPSGLEAQGPSGECGVESASAVAGQVSGVSAPTSLSAGETRDLQARGIASCLGLLGALRDAGGSLFCASLSAADSERYEEGSGSRVRGGGKGREIRQRQMACAVDKLFEELLFLLLPGNSTRLAANETNFDLPANASSLLGEEGEESEKPTETPTASGVRLREARDAHQRLADSEREARQLAMRGGCPSERARFLKGCRRIDTPSSALDRTRRRDASTEKSQILSTSEYDDCGSECDEESADEEKENDSLPGTVPRRGRRADRSSAPRATSRRSRGHHRRDRMPSLALSPASSSRASSRAGHPLRVLPAPSRSFAAEPPPLSAVSAPGVHAASLLRLSRVTNALFSPLVLFLLERLLAAASVRSLPVFCSRLAARLALWPAPALLGSLLEERRKERLREAPDDGEAEAERCREVFLLPLRMAAALCRRCLRVLGEESGGLLLLLAAHAAGAATTGRDLEEAGGGHVQEGERAASAGLRSGFAAADRGTRAAPVFVGQGVCVVTRDAKEELDVEKALALLNELLSGLRLALWAALECWKEAAPHLAPRFAPSGPATHRPGVSDAPADSYRPVSPRSREASAPLAPLASAPRGTTRRDEELAHVPAALQVTLRSLATASVRFCLLRETSARPQGGDEATDRDGRAAADALEADRRWKKEFQGDVMCEAEAETDAVREAEGKARGATKAALFDDAGRGERLERSVRKQQKRLALLRAAEHFVSNSEQTVEFLQRVATEDIVPLLSHFRPDQVFPTSFGGSPRRGPSRTQGALDRLLLDASPESSSAALAELESDRKPLRHGGIDELHVAEDEASASSPKREARYDVFRKHSHLFSSSSALSSASTPGSHAPRADPRSKAAARSCFSGMLPDGLEADEDEGLRGDASPSGCEDFPSLLRRLEALRSRWTLEARRLARLRSRLLLSASPPGGTVRLRPDAEGRGAWTGEGFESGSSCSHANWQSLVARTRAEEAGEGTPMEAALKSLRGACEGGAGGNASRRDGGEREANASFQRPERQLEMWGRRDSKRRRDDDAWREAGDARNEEAEEYAQLLDALIDPSFPDPMRLIDEPHGEAAQLSCEEDEIAEDALEAGAARAVATRENLREGKSGVYRLASDPGADESGERRERKRALTLMRPGKIRPVWFSFINSLFNSGAPHSSFKEEKR